MQPEMIGGRYRVVRAIGRGGMGTVWLCRDELLQRDVAVKQVGMLPGASVTDSARALREARSSAALSHRNVVTVFDVVEEDRAIWMVMELVPGRSLAELVKQQGPLDPARVADIGAQIAEGLAAAHAVGTIHRDVKPGNVLVRDDGLAAISDFGIARSAGDPALTQSGLLTGTPSYFSPELARGAPPSAPSDVWALGATLYAAVQGRPPYRQQDNPVAVLHDIASQQPPRPDRADFLEPALLRMLDRDPDSRWSMDDAAHALHRLARDNAAENTRAETLLTAPSAASLRARSAAGTGQSRERTSRAGAGAPPTSSATASTPAASAPAQRLLSDPGSTGRSRGRLLLATLALLLLVGAGIGYALTRDTGAGADPAATDRGSARAGSSDSTTPSRDAGAARSPSGSTSPSTPATPSATPSGRGSSTPSPTASTSPRDSSTVDAASVTPFLQGYFADAPGGSDEAWAQLGPGMQAQGRSTYDRFWGGIASVDVADVEPVAANAVEVTLTYTRTDGTTSPERKRLELLRTDDGGYLINGDEPAG
ncbi:MAG TPA: serine/threonine-protein kinase [Nocardioidaceae bacterium]|nr:serine/threonine-protein kinase [Nocardioidaceae bacterium]